MPPELSFGKFINALKLFSTGIEMHRLNNNKYISMAMSLGDSIFYESQQGFGEELFEGLSDL